jgi:hypothetical protein
MANVYQVELWRDMFVVLGSSAAALIGLLFIATSLHLNEIVNNPISHRRAFNNTCYLLIILVETLLLLIPQPMPVVGTELIVINLFGLWLPLKVISTLVKDKEGYRRAGGQIHRGSIFFTSFLLGIAGGATLTERLNWGLYLVTASCIILLVMVVFGAWSIMVGVGQVGKTKGIN